MATAFLFPGQGSQRAGMGSNLFEAGYLEPETEKAFDRILGYSIRELCCGDDAGRLADTLYTQPAIFVVNLLAAEAARREHGKADCYAGHSLGELNALVAAGVVEPVDGLRLVAKRAELMAKASGGGMAAVIGITAERITNELADRQIGDVAVANYNSPNQTVISGPLASIERAKTALEEGGAQMVVPLPVSAAFHSPAMLDAAESFFDYVDTIRFRLPVRPVYANATAQPYPMDGSPKHIRRLLVRQIVSPVRWSATIVAMRAAGTSRFIETGPGQVLTRLLDQIPHTATEATPVAA